MVTVFIPDLIARWKRKVSKFFDSLLDFKLRNNRKYILLFLLPIIIVIAEHKM